MAVELDRIQQAARNVDRIVSDQEMIAIWLRRQVSEHTRTSYEHVWNAWQAHSMGLPMANTTLAHLQDFQGFLAQGRKPGSVNTMMSALRSAFAMAHRRGYVRSNPCAEINDLPNPNQSGTASALGRRILTRTEVARLLEAARAGRDFALYLTALPHGLPSFRSTCPAVGRPAPGQPTTHIDRPAGEGRQGPSDSPVGPPVAKR